MSSVPKIRKDIVKKPRKRTYEFPGPPVKLAGLDNHLPDVVPGIALIENLVGAIKKRTIHVLFFQVFVNIPNRIWPFRCPIDPFEHLEICFYGVACEQFIK